LIERDCKLEYFLITQDHRIPNYPEPLGMSKSFFKQEKLDEFNPVQLQIKDKESIEYVDFIERPVPLVSDELKQLLKQFEKKAGFTPVVLVDLKRGVQSLYWSLHLPKVDCLSSHSEFNKNGTINKLVLNPVPAAAFRMFQVDRVIEDFIMINLVLVESLLRRDLTGFRFTRVEVEKEND
jgi:hypothetical protein